MKTYYCEPCKIYWEYHSNYIDIDPGFYVEGTPKKLCPYCVKEKKRYNRKQRVRRETWFYSDKILRRGKDFVTHVADYYNTVVTSVTPSGLKYARIPDKKRGPYKRRKK